MNFPLSYPPLEQCQIALLATNLSVRILLRQVLFCTEIKLLPGLATKLKTRFNHAHGHAKERQTCCSAFYSSSPCYCPCQVFPAARVWMACPGTIPLSGRTVGACAPALARSRNCHRQSGKTTWKKRDQIVLIRVLPFVRGDLVLCTHGVTAVKLSLVLLMPAPLSAASIGFKSHGL